jgi:hypothetical protein
LNLRGLKVSWRWETTGGLERCKVTKRFGFGVGRNGIFYFFFSRRGWGEAQILKGRVRGVWAVHPTKFAEVPRANLGEAGGRGTCLRPTGIRGQRAAGER